MGLGRWEPTGKGGHVKALPLLPGQVTRPPMLCSMRCSHNSQSAFKLKYIPVKTQCQESPKILPGFADTHPTVRSPLS